MAAEAREPEPDTDASKDPADVARVAEIAAADGDYETLEEAGLLLASLARIRRDVERQEEVRD